MPGGRPSKNSRGQVLDPTTGKYRTGRPTVVTPEVICKLEEAFAMGCGDVEACLYADISTVAFYKFQKENADFAKRKNELKETPVLAARYEVIKGIKDNCEFALKVLERINKKEFATRSEITGAEGKQININITPEQAEKIEKASKK